jgi:hypothetical protein
MRYRSKVSKYAAQIRLAHSIDACQAFEHAQLRTKIMMQQQDNITNCEGSLS